MELIQNSVIFRFRLRLGNHEENEQVIITNKQVSIHPSYTAGQQYFDIALVKVNHVNFSNSIAPICVPLTENSNYFEKSLYVTGWLNQAHSSSTSSNRIFQSARYIFSYSCYSIKLFRNKL